MAKVKIDPGHGGKDRDNIGYSGRYVEAEGTLTISKAVKDYLELYNGVKSDLTREDDTTVSLSDRGNSAAGYDLFISNHTNGFSDPSVRGVEVFYSVDIPKDRELAAEISAAIAKAFNTIDRGAKLWESENYPGEDHLTVIDKAQDSGCPHVFLVEALFHSNRIEEEILLEPDNLVLIGFLEASVIADHFNLVLSEQPPQYAIDSGSWAWGIAEGLNDGLGPNNITTEAQVMEFLHRYHKIFYKEV